MLFLPTPASADLPIVCAKLGVFMPCQKSFQIEDIQVYYSCPLLEAQSLQCYVQTSSNWVFWCPPQGILSRRYSNNVIPAHPWKPRLFNFWCKTRCFHAFPKVFQIENIQIYVIPAHPWQCRFANCMCKTWRFHAFPKAFQIEDIQIYYSRQPLKAQSLQFNVQTSSKLGVLMPSQRRFK